MISAMRPPRLARTWSARVALILPLALAEGAASGFPVAASSACIAGWAGTRSAMVARPAVTSGAIPASSRNGTTSVSGPGQCASASARAVSSNTPIPSAAARSATCTISGLKLGLPFAA